jgi:hypothetical protein
MSDYFKPWRRKLGIATLMMACVFAAAWVRSLMLTDVVRVPLWQFGKIGIASNVGYFSFAWASHERSNNGFNWITYPFEVTALISYAPWTFDFTSKTPVQPVMGYWSVVIPLTLVSAWLLLSKPRKPKSTSQA